MASPENHRIITGSLCSRIWVGALQIGSGCIYQRERIELTRVTSHEARCVYAPRGAETSEAGNLAARVVPVPRCYGFLERRRWMATLSVRSS
jgi:hypothetical protein